MKEEELKGPRTIGSRSNSEQKPPVVELVLGIVT
jgi:hypothetical protein